MMWRPLRVVVVEPSSLVRRQIREQLADHERLKVVATSSSSKRAQMAIAHAGADVLLVEANLPGEDGLHLVRRLHTRSPLPVVVYSQQVSPDLQRRARREGIPEILSKPRRTTDPGDFWSRLGAALTHAVDAGCGELPLNNQPTRLIAIAISTGGPAVLRQLMGQLPRGLPPIVIVQHMREGFLAPFAAQLDELSEIPIGLATPGGLLRPSHCYIAPNAHQTRVVDGPQGLHFDLGPPVPMSGHTPSGDALMYSVAFNVGGAALGLVLTGMGTDGAMGLLAMRRSGARTLAQDEQTSTVFGMPKAAVANGAARRVVGLSELAQVLQMHVQR